MRFIMPTVEHQVHLTWSRSSLLLSSQCDTKGYVIWYGRFGYHCWV